MYYYKVEPTPFGRFPARAGAQTGRSLRVASGPFRLAAYLAIALLLSGSRHASRNQGIRPPAGHRCTRESLPYEALQLVAARWGETIVAIIDAGRVVALDLDAAHGVTDGSCLDD